MESAGVASVELKGERALSPEPALVLVVSTLVEAYDSLRAVLRGSRWMLCQTFSRLGAMEFVDLGATPVVICDHDFPDGGWQHLWADLSQRVVPPSLIVCSPAVDERLWAQVFNAGAFDVLLRPFEPEEVHRIMDAAWSSWNRRTGSLRARRKNAARVLPRG